MKFEEVARAAGRDAVEAGRRLTRPEIALVRSRRTRGGVFAAAFALTLLAVGAVALWPGGGSADEAQVTTTTTSPATNPPTSTVPSTILPETTTTTSSSPLTTVPAAPDFDIWTLIYPATWYRGSSELMPALGWDSATVTTFPLRPGGAGCAQVPVNALQDMTASDVLLTIFFTGRESPVDTIPWPVDGFDDNVFPESGPTDVDECSGRSDLEVHWGYWHRDGEALYVLAVFGSDVSAARRAESWAILSSLERQSEGSDPGACVVTEPPVPGLEVPESYPDQPPFGVWYGTTDLWTVLEMDGVYGPRKSVWWSASFPGGIRESRPEVFVTWHRLDGGRTPVENGGQATNAWDEGSGWFMIAGLDPEEPGCWEITATYKGETLSYVAAIR